MPYLISNARQTAVKSYRAENEVGVILFDGVYDVKFGGLNDEALEGHPLYGVGLSPYAAHEVINSDWIAESERRNSVHDYHRGGWQQRMKHYVLASTMTRWNVSPGI